MDKDEEAGLRAHAVTVATDHGEGHPDRPVSVERNGALIPVESIAASWREEERVGYRVRLADGSMWLLYYVPELELWSGVMDAGHAGTGPP